MALKCENQVSDPQTYVFMGITWNIAKMQILMYSVHISNEHPGDARAASSHTIL